MNTKLACLALLLTFSAMANETVVNDAHRYLQTGEMSSNLAFLTNKIISQNVELSVEEAVSVVLSNAESQKK